MKQQQQLQYLHKYEYIYIHFPIEKLKLIYDVIVGFFL